METPKDVVENKSEAEPTVAKPHTKKAKYAVVVRQGSFEVDKHFYTKVLNAQIHPLVAHFMRMDNERIISRYTHLYPTVDRKALEELLAYKPSYFRWSGADLFNVTEAKGGRKMVVIETNSCPSGQKSFPLLNEGEEKNGYQYLIDYTFKPYLEECAANGKMIEGVLAVVFDKNETEAAGYAACLADSFNEEVLLVETHDHEEETNVRWTSDWVLEARTSDGQWRRIRAAFRYVTQKPWSRLPVAGAKTLILNPVVACLAGGRNKLVAAKAYDFFNAEFEPKGLGIRVPETREDVAKDEIPLWVKSMGDHAVVKVPYSNAGQGVYTITSKQELEELMKELNQQGAYEQYIVQSLIGNYSWSSVTRHGQYFHVGTIPDKNKNIYCADIRLMVHYSYTHKSFRPLAIYSRRARKPLPQNLSPGETSWDYLGTNLSFKLDDDTWSTETNRLLLMDTRDFNRLGVGTDDLIDAYIQTVLATVAIDKLARKLMHVNAEGQMEFNHSLFLSLNKDPVLHGEILDPSHPHSQ
jgi:hypothetical protein